MRFFARVAESSAIAPVDAAAVGARVRGHLPVLDGLRGVAILAVLLHNAAGEQRHAASHWLKAVYFAHAPGWVGVQLFFVLSGFLITGILLDSPGVSGLPRFWIRRGLRIFPLYFCFLLLVTVIAPLFARPGPLFQPLGARWWYWTYLCNWVQPSGREIPALAHFWSLAIEEQFYLVWPLVVVALDARSLLRACLSLALLALAIRAGLRLSGVHWSIVYQCTITRMDALTIGGAAAVVVRDTRWALRFVPHAPRVAITTGAALLVMAPLTGGFAVGNLAVQTVGFSLLGVFCAALIVTLVAAPRAPLARAVGVGWLRWLGKHSYAIYVFHFPIAKMLGARLSPTINGPSTGRALAAMVLMEVLVAGLSLIAAVASWHLLERWALAQKDRWAPTDRLARAYGVPSQRGA